MTDAAIRCTTHHAACDCREAATRAALDAADALADEVVRLGDNDAGWSSVQRRIEAYRAARGAR